jgi:hypothetical protein
MSLAVGVENMIDPWAAQTILSDLLDPKHPLLASLGDPAIPAAFDLIPVSLWPELSSELVKMRHSAAPPSSHLARFRENYRELASRQNVPIRSVAPDQVRASLQSGLSSALGEPTRATRAGLSYSIDLASVTVVTRIECGGRVSDVLCMHDVRARGGLELVQSESLVRLLGINHGIGWTVHSVQDLDRVVDQVTRCAKHVVGAPWDSVAVASVR